MEPSPDKVVAAHFFTRLHRMTAQGTYRDAAEGALKLCAIHLHRSADYALAADDWRPHPLDSVLVGMPGEDRTDALLTAAKQRYAPGKVVIPLGPTQSAPALGELTLPHPDQAQSIPTLSGCVRCLRPTRPNCLNGWNG